MSRIAKEGEIIDGHLEFLHSLMERGGPEPRDYYELDAWIAEVADQLKAGRLRDDDISRLVEGFGDAFSTETMQGFAFRKPHGYAGDFEIIERIYERYTSDQAKLNKWDVYWQQHSAAHAVRNRVNVFADELGRVCSERGAEVMHVLNLASGPGRDMKQFFELNPSANVHFDCVDQDQNAIEYAKNLCKESMQRIRGTDLVSQFECTEVS